MPLSLIHAQSSRKLEHPIVVSVPHAGLTVPEERCDLRLLSKNVFLRDVDFEIHQAWQQPAREMDLSLIKAESHRYALDLNRRLDQVDASMIEGHPRAVGAESRGLFWTRSTHDEPLGAPGTDFKPLSPQTAQALVDTLWKPYYQILAAELKRVHEKFGFAILIDAHSMPSKGTNFHADPGTLRAHIVPGDLKGRSADPQITRIAEQTAQNLGLSVKRNDPYSGGGITQHFARPSTGYHSLQIEVNRELYMDETRFEVLPEGMARLQNFAREFLTRLSSWRPS